MAAKLQSEFNEQVDVDIGIIDNRTMPNSIESDRIANNAVAKIKI